VIPPPVRPSALSTTTVTAASGYHPVLGLRRDVAVLATESGPRVPVTSTPVTRLADRRAGVEEEMHSPGRADRPRMDPVVRAGHRAGAVTARNGQTRGRMTLQTRATSCRIGRPNRWGSAPCALEHYRGECQCGQPPRQSGRHQAQHAQYRRHHAHHVVRDPRGLASSAHVPRGEQRGQPRVTRHDRTFISCSTRCPVRSNMRLPPAPLNTNSGVPRSERANSRSGHNPGVIPLRQKDESLSAVVRP